MGHRTSWTRREAIGRARVAPVPTGGGLHLHWPWRVLPAALILLLVPTLARGGDGDPAVPLEHEGGGAGSGGGAPEPSAGPCLQPEERELVRARVEWNRDLLFSLGKIRLNRNDRFRFRWPLRAVGSAAQAFDVHNVPGFVDHDERAPGYLLDYRCGTRTYDWASGLNHRGSDFATSPLPWIWMDLDAVQVVAIAAGTIVGKDDGNPDESCSVSSPTPWNAVYVAQEDGSVAWYGHLKAYSLTPRGLGDRVEAGDYLGVVGSSGRSTTPHLHLELYDFDGELLDPFAGPCNATTGNSRWSSQRPYYDSAINQLMVGTALLVRPPCPGRAVTNETNTITRGTLAYFTAFYHDQLAGQVSDHVVRRPDGSVFFSWSQSTTVPHYVASYWWRSLNIGLAAPPGTWTWEVTYEGRLYQKSFTVL